MSKSLINRYPSASTVDDFVKVHSLKSQCLTQLRRLGRAVARYISLSDEPKIYQCTGRQGEQYWRIYDPRLNQNITLSTDIEVRLWLEQRYTQ